MLPKTVCLLILISVVLSDSEHGKLRVKRGKYFSNPPARIYRLPPPPHLVKGAFSYTPPPFKTHEDSSFRSKVRRPPDDGLADEDINNLVRHLSKKDLDKIVEFAGVKDSYVEKYRGDYSERNEYSRPYKKPERTGNYRSEDAEKFSLNGPYVKDHNERPDKIEYSENYVTVNPNIFNPPPNYPEHFDPNPNPNFINDAPHGKVFHSNPPESFDTKVVYFNAEESRPPSPEVELSDSRIVYENSQTFQAPSLQPFHTKVANPFPKPTNQYSYPSLDETRDTIFSNTHFDTEESMNSKISYVTPPTNYFNRNYVNLYTNSSTMKEEELPKPLNLREEPEYVGSNTNNVPTVVNPDSYRVESFKDLPLMNYHDSKLHTVSSYYVPHYTVTSTKSRQIAESSSSPLSSHLPPSSSKVLPIERAPTGYSGRDESDAHLKAVKIWTHHSTGSAYTLHDDGTLSPERPRTKYG